MATTADPASTSPSPADDVVRTSTGRPGRPAATGRRAPTLRADGPEPARPLAVELGDPGPLVDDHAALQGDPAEAARESRRLDRRRAGHEGPGPHHRRAHALRDVLGAHRHVPVAHAESLARLDRLGPLAVLGRRRADRDRSGLRYQASTPLAAHHAPDLVDGVVHRPGGGQRPGLAVALDERRRARPTSRSRTRRCARTARRRRCRPRAGRPARPARARGAGAPSTARCSRRRR